MNRTPRLRRRSGGREKGMALFLAILLLLVITVMGVALMFTASIEQTLAGTETKISKIFYAADSGIEYGSAMLQSTLNYAGGVMPVGVSTHYPGGGAPDMQVTIAQPVLLGYTWRWWPPLRRLRALLGEKTIGTLRHVQFHMSAHLADFRKSLALVFLQ